jgi:hypothetical protein
MQNYLSEKLFKFAAKVYKFSVVLINNCFSNRVIVKLTNMKRACKGTQLLLVNQSATEHFGKVKNQKACFMLGFYLRGL